MTDVQIKSFLVAAECENFTKAAEKLFITQPSLGRHIASLEDELGVILFIRERKSVHLSKAGEIFKEFVLDTSNNFKLTMNRINAEIRKSNHELIIGTVPGLRIGEVYADAFKQFTVANPSFSLKLVELPYTEVIHKLELNDIDVAIITKSAIMDYSDVFDYHECMYVREGLIMSADNHDFSDPVALFEKIKDECFIVLDENECALDKKQQLQTMHRLGITKYLIASDYDTHSLMIEAGIGISTVGHLHKICTNKNFRFVPLPNENINIDVVAWAKVNKNVCIQAFVEALKSTGFSI